MESPYYDRLQAVAELSLDDLDETRQYATMVEEVGYVRHDVKDFMEAVQQGLKGKAGDSVLAAAGSVLDDIGDKLTGVIMKAREQHQAARDAMGEAKGRFANEVSENLVSPGYAAVVMAAGSVLLPGLGTMAAGAYLERLAGSNNEKREEQAKEILDVLDGKIKAVSQIPLPIIHPVSWPDPGPGRFEPIPREDPTGAGSGSGGSAGAGSGGGLGSGPVPAGGVPSGWTGGSDGWPAGVLASSDSSSGWPSFVGSSPGSSSSVSSGPGWSSSPGSSSGWSGSPSPGAGSGWAGGSSGSSPSGSSSGERDWGVVPVVVTLPNGSMAGMVPAPVLDPWSSSWKAGYSSVPVSSLLPPGGGVSGGWAGAGAPGMGGAGVVGSGAPGVGGVGGGAGSARFGSLAGGAGVLGAGGARAAGAGAAGSPGSSGAAGEAGAAGAGSRGGVAGGGMGAGGSQDEKLKRRKYKVFKFRADRDPEDWEMPEAAGPGRAEDLKPLYSEDDPEYWEAPRRPGGTRR